MRGCVVKTADCGSGSLTQARNDGKRKSLPEIFRQALFKTTAKTDSRLRHSGMTSIDLTESFFYKTFQYHYMTFIRLFGGSQKSNIAFCKKGFYFGKKVFRFRIFVKLFDVLFFEYAKGVFFAVKVLPKFR